MTGTSSTSSTFSGKTGSVTVGSDGKAVKRLLTAHDGRQIIFLNDDGEPVTLPGTAIIFLDVLINLYEVFITAQIAAKAQTELQQITMNAADEKLVPCLEAHPELLRDGSFLKGIVSVQQVDAILIECDAHVNNWMVKKMTDGRYKIFPIDRSAFAGIFSQTVGFSLAAGSVENLGNGCYYEVLAPAKASRWSTLQFTPLAFFQKAGYPWRSLFMGQEDNPVMVKLRDVLVQVYEENASDIWLMALGKILYLPAVLSDLASSNSLVKTFAESKLKNLLQARLRALMSLPAFAGVIDSYKEADPSFNSLANRVVELTLANEDKKLVPPGLKAYLKKEILSVVRKQKSFNETMATVKKHLMRLLPSYFARSFNKGVGLKGGVGKFLCCLDLSVMEGMGRHVLQLLIREQILVPLPVELGGKKDSKDMPMRFYLDCAVLAEKHNNNTLKRALKLASEADRGVIPRYRKLARLQILNSNLERLFAGPVQWHQGKGLSLNPEDMVLNEAVIQKLVVNRYLYMVEGFVERNIQPCDLVVDLQSMTEMNLPLLQEATTAAREKDKAFQTQVNYWRESIAPCKLQLHASKNHIETVCMTISDTLGNQSYIYFSKEVDASGCLESTQSAILRGINGLLGVSVNLVSAMKSTFSWLAMLKASFFVESDSNCRASVLRVARKPADSRLIASMAKGELMRPLTRRVRKPEFSVLVKLAEILCRWRVKFQVDSAVVCFPITYKHNRRIKLFLKSLAELGASSAENTEKGVLVLKPGNLTLEKIAESETRFVEIFNSRSSRQGTSSYPSFHRRGGRSKVTVLPSITEEECKVAVTAV